MLQVVMLLINSISELGHFWGSLYVRRGIFKQYSVRCFVCDLQTSKKRC